MVLAGDVGGTKTLLALFEPRGRALVPIRETVLASQTTGAVEDALAEFVRTAGGMRIDAACLGVAGPVVGGRSTATNLPWTVDEARVAAALGVQRARLLNDLEAMGYGVLALDDHAVQTLQPGTPRPGTMAVIAAGTGLGEAMIVSDGGRPRVVASEGGHADFAPRGDLEIELLRFLAREYGHVSWERVLSGPGLLNIYRFLRDTGRGEEPAWLAERLAGDDPSAAISEIALAGGHPLCVEALSVFVSVYGAEAGNLALVTLALGGVWIGGGIAPKIRPRLRDGTFLAAFRDKGRMRPLLETIPVRLVLEPRAALLGAARVAAEMAAEG